jgi:hypothetical protein
MWSDDTGRNRGQFELYYSKGRLTGFVNYGAIFRGQFGSAFQKESSLDQNPAGVAPAAVHVAFGSNLGDNQKENYYSWALVQGVSTPVPTATYTPIASPTPCIDGRYSDVLPTDYFYTAAYELGRTNPPVMSGYADCTFKPYNNITRGQTAKIVVLGAGIPNDLTGAPHFSDVPATNPFYIYIETAYNNDIITGYADGTFRPGNNVTRGQFSKMVQKGFAIPVDTGGGPHFSDVAPGSTFYNYIETLYNADLISGYSDGTFRPNNNLTRGQGAKIVYEARLLVGEENTPTETPNPEATPTETPVTFTDTPVVDTPTVTSTPEAPTDTPVPTDTPTETPAAVRE